MPQLMNFNCTSWLKSQIFPIIRHRPSDECDYGAIMDTRLPPRSSGTGCIVSCFGLQCSPLLFSGTAILCWRQRWMRQMPQIKWSQMKLAHSLCPTKTSKRSREWMKRWAPKPTATAVCRDDDDGILSMLQRSGSRQWKTWKRYRAGPKHRLWSICKR